MEEQISTNNQSNTETSENLEPPHKKTKNELSKERDRLESRLISVLSCVVCFDLPNGPIYQVSIYLLVLTCRCFTSLC